MRIILSISLLISVLFSFGQGLPSPEQLSSDTRASLLTCGPGHDISSHFGHSALRIHDEATGLDVVFNYGMFDYSDPDFATKFAKRTMPYFLHVSSYENFASVYYQEKRYVYEQEILLNSKGIKDLYAFVFNNYVDESQRFYMYEFFFDNCTTRLRDAIFLAASSQGEFEWAKHEDADQFTYREIIDSGFYEDPWLDFGIDLVLGSRLDVTVSNENLMFLPGYMSQIAEKTLLNGKPLFGEIKYDPRLRFEFEKIEPSWFTPTLFFWIVFVLIFILSVIFTKKKWFKIIDATLFFFFGVFGILLLFMWFGTDHNATKMNYNLIWATPLHLLSIAVLFWKKLREKISWYYLAMAGLMLLLVLLFWALPQSFHPATKPIVILLAYRYYSLHRLDEMKV